MPKRQDQTKITIYLDDWLADLMKKHADANMRSMNGEIAYVLQEHYRTHPLAQVSLLEPQPQPAWPGAVVSHVQQSTAAVTAFNGEGEPEVVIAEPSPLDGTPFEGIDRDSGTKQRRVPCVHRIPADSYCRHCD